MAKTKTSAKPEAFSLVKAPIRKLRKGIRTITHDPTRNLKDVHLINQALLQCLWEGDVEAFKEVLKAHYEAINTAAALKKIGLSKRTFYEALSEKGNPRLDTISKIIQGLKNLKFSTFP
jgi:probable addiction module antidote protein